MTLYAMRDKNSGLFVNYCEVEGYNLDEVPEINNFSEEVMIEMFNELKDDDTFDTANLELCEVNIGIGPKIA